MNICEWMISWNNFCFVTVDVSDYRYVNFLKDVPTDDLTVNRPLLERDDFQKDVF
jgi:hypothetical protein